MCAQNRLFTVFTLLFLSACASVNNPEGGPRDERKPKLTAITPVNGSTNYKGKVITMTFDEDVRPVDFNKQLIISPNTDNTYLVKNDRKTVTIEFDKNLEPNTTYFLNFREAIEDVTESNKTEPISLSFSTGNTLDTGRVNGTVTDYINNYPEDNLTIGLYPESDTSNIKDHKPYYFTKSHSDGSFQLNNIKAGNYWIFALNDKNGNEYYDADKEKIAYLLKPIEVNPIADSIQLKTVWIDNQKPYILSTENALDQNTLIFNEGIKSLIFKTLTKPEKETKPAITKSTDGKRISIYPENGVLSEKLIAYSTDSAGNKGIDTVRFLLSGKKSISKRIMYKANKLELAVDQPNEITLTFPVPIKITGNQPFTILEDTIRKIKPAYPKDIKLSENNTEISFTYTPKAKKQTVLELDTSQLVAINGAALPKQSTTFNLSRKTTTGSIEGLIRTNYTQYTVELLDEQGKIVDAKENARKLNYPKLEPGNYTIRVKIDEDKDGKWELGDKQLKTKAEKLYIYPKKISVRANWEISDLILTF